MNALLDFLNYERTVKTWQFIIYVVIAVLVGNVTVAILNSIF